MSARWHHLAAQLRELFTPILHDAGTEREIGSTPVLLSRALVATRLLVDRCRQESFHGFKTWLLAIHELLDHLFHEPTLASRGESALTALVVYEEELLESLDAGTTLLATVKIQRILSLQQVILASWGRSSRPEVATTVLSAGAAVPGPVQNLVLLLVSGVLRTSALHEKLRIADYQVVLCSDIDEVVAQLRSGKAFRAALCDQVEPTRHLARLAKRLRQSGLVTPPLIMVTGSSWSKLADHACRLGAAGVWCPPYRTSDLTALLPPTAI